MGAQLSACMLVGIGKSIPHRLGFTVARWMLQKSRGEDMFVMFMLEAFQTGF